MSEDPRPFEPDWTLSPGTLLHEILTERGIYPLGLARGCGLPEETIRGVLDASVPVDENIAARLSVALGVSAQFFLNAERIYREALARGATDSSWGSREL